MSETDQQDPNNADQSEGQASVMSMMSGAQEQPLGLEDEGEEDSAGGSSVNGSVVLLAGVAIVLIGAVILMRALQTEKLDETGVSPKLQAKVERYIGEGEGTVTPAGASQQSDVPGMNKNTDAIISMFSRDLSDKQVPIQFVKKNPFRLSLPEPEPEPKKKQKKDKPDPEKQRQKRLAKLRDHVSRMTLQSVMGGDQPVAVINGDLYQAGDAIGPFTITQISRTRVTLEAAQESFALTMDNNS